MCSLCEPEKWGDSCVVEKEVICRNMGYMKVSFCFSHGTNTYFLRDEEGNTFRLHRCMVCGRKLY